jgi:uncharacterized protein (DUF1501 family)
MKTPFTTLPVTRREFLRWGGRGAGLLAFSRFAPSFLVQSALAGTPAPEKDRNILVLIQLAGGNDGLNTVIPYQDANYYRLRPTLGIPKAQVVPVTDTLGFNPGCAALAALFKEGRLGVVQNVGYPNPNHSHFRSSEIWETASDSNESLATGWIGRFLDNACAGQPAAATDDPVAIHSTGETPQTFTAAQAHPTFGLGLGAAAGNLRQQRENLTLLRQIASQDHHDENASASFLKATLMDALVTEQKVQNVLGAYKPGSTYPASPFANSLRSVAALIASGLPTRVYFVQLGGFDNHQNQLNVHINNLRTLSEGLAAFQKDLMAKMLDSQVLTMTFSEFGRRPSENASRGTDHGTAAPLFVMGSRLKGTLFGTAPVLANLPKNQDITFSTDFRQIYATVLDKWLNGPADKVLGQSYTSLGFI